MLNSLRIKNFRCFEDLEIESLGRVNLIVGRNSVGKSSLLEAMSIYSKRADIQAVIDMFSMRDEYQREDEETFQKALETLFYGRDNLDKTSYNSIFIGPDRASSNYLALKITPFLEQIETTDDGERTFKTVKRTELDNYQQSLFSDDEDFGDKETKLGLSIDDGKSKRLLEIAKLYRRITPRRKTSDQTETPSSFVPTKIVSSDQLALLWDKIIFTPHEESIKDILSLIHKSIRDIGFIKASGYSREDNRIPVVKLNEMQKPVPLKSLGEGMSRLLQIFLHAFQAQKGYLMIDEFENGLHYSIQEEVWEKLFQLAEELDIQVFATTHSRDTIDAFNKVTLKHPDIKGNIISLARSVAKSEEGKIFATVYDEQSGDIEMLEQTGIEVR